MFHSRTMNKVAIEPGKAGSIRVDKGQAFRIINNHGQQVVDTWVFNARNMTEYLSMSQSRSATYKLMFDPGDVLVSNLFNPIVAFSDDTSAGGHDTLHAACSPGSYKHYGIMVQHTSCQNNCFSELAQYNHHPDSIPDPWNLFENTIVNSDLSLQDMPSNAQAGTYVELNAKMDVIVVCSACPSTVGNISGKNPRGATVQLLDSSERISTLNGFDRLSGPFVSAMSIGQDDMTRMQSISASKVTYSPA